MDYHPTAVDVIAPDVSNNSNADKLDLRNQQRRRRLGSRRDEIKNSVLNRVREAKTHEAPQQQQQQRPPTSHISKQEVNSTSSNDINVQQQVATAQGVAPFQRKTLIMPSGRRGRRKTTMIDNNSKPLDLMSISVKPTTSSIKDDAPHSKEFQQKSRAATEEVPNSPDKKEQRRKTTLSIGRQLMPRSHSKRGKTLMNHSNLLRTSHADMKKRPSLVIPSVEPALLFGLEDAEDSDSEFTEPMSRSSSLSSSAGAEESWRTSFSRSLPTRSFSFDEIPQVQQIRENAMHKREQIKLRNKTRLSSTSLDKEQVVCELVEEENEEESSSALKKHHEQPQQPTIEWKRAAPRSMSSASIDFAPQDACLSPPPMEPSKRALSIDLTFATTTITTTTTTTTPTGSQASALRKREQIKLRNKTRLSSASVEDQPLDDAEYGTEHREPPTKTEIGRGTARSMSAMSLPFSENGVCLSPPPSMEPPKRALSNMELSNKNAGNATTTQAAAALQKREQIKLRNQTRLPPSSSLKQKQFQLAAMKRNDELEQDESVFGQQQQQQPNLKSELGRVARSKSAVSLPFSQTNICLSPPTLEPSGRALTLQLSKSFNAHNNSAGLKKREQIKRRNQNRMSAAVLQQQQQLLIGEKEPALVEPKQLGSVKKTEVSRRAPVARSMSSSKLVLSQKNDVGLSSTPMEPFGRALSTELLVVNQTATTLATTNSSCQAGAEAGAPTMTNRALSPQLATRKRSVEKRERMTQQRREHIKQRNKTILSTSMKEQSNVLVEETEKKEAEIMTMGANEEPALEQPTNTKRELGGRSIARSRSAKLLSPKDAVCIAPVEPSGRALSLELLDIHDTSQSSSSGEPTTLEEVAAILPRNPSFRQRSVQKRERIKQRNQKRATWKPSLSQEKLRVELEKQ